MNLFEAKTTSYPQDSQLNPKLWSLLEGAGDLVKLDINNFRSRVIIRVIPFRAWVYNFTYRPTYYVPFARCK